VKWKCRATIQKGEVSFVHSIPQNHVVRVVVNAVVNKINDSSTSEQIETFAETDFINMVTAKIAVIITDPQNNDVVSKTLTHEQYVFYNPTRTGTYSIRYVDEYKLN